MAEAESATDSGVAPDDGDQVTVSGALLDGYVNVSEAKLRLVTSLGETAEGGQVIVPFLDAMLECERGSDERQETFKGLLTFDNAAFIVDEFAEAIAEAASQMEDLSRGDLAPHPSTIEYVLGRMRDAKSSLDDATASLVRLSAPLVQAADKAEGTA